MQVKVIRVPGRTNTVEVPDTGATVAEALNQASVTIDSGENVTLNGAPAPLTAMLAEGDKIILAKGAKGNL